MDKTNTIISPKGGFWQWVHQLGSAQRYYNWTKYWLAPLWVLAVVLLSIGWIWGLFFAPQDFQQADAFRIIYLHVPAAMGSMAVYTMMAILSALFLVWRFKAAQVMTLALAPIGTIMTLIALVTGSLWGKPMWGTWWVFDARLTSELFLLFLYIGYSALYSSIENKQKAFKLCCYLSLVGVVDIPIIHYSVNWWYSLHQGSTLFLLQKPTMDTQMVIPLFISLFGTFFLIAACAFVRSRQILLWQERQSTWVRSYL